MHWKASRYRNGHKSTQANERALLCVTQEYATMIPREDEHPLPPEWADAWRLAHDESYHMREGEKDGVIEILVKRGKPTSVRCQGARAVKAQGMPPELLEPTG